MDPIRSAYEDDPDMLEIVREFASELPDRIQRLDSLLSAGSFSDLQTLAHQLKGAGGGYGFPQITEAAARLEQSLKTGADEPVVKDRAAELRQILSRVVVPETN